MEFKWECTSNCPFHAVTNIQQHTRECTLSRYSAIHEWRAAEEDRMEMIPSVVIAANLLEYTLSGQYGRYTALDIGEQIVKALGIL